MKAKKSIYQEYRKRLVDNPNSLARKIAEKFDIEKTHIYAYKDGVRVSIGLYGFWISVFIKPRKLGPLQFYEMYYIKDGKKRKKITFTLNTLLKIIKTVDIQDVHQQNK